MADTKVFVDGVENMGRSYSGIGVWDSYLLWISMEYFLSSIWI